MRWTTGLKGLIYGSVKSSLWFRSWMLNYLKKKKKKKNEREKYENLADFVQPPTFRFDQACNVLIYFDLFFHICQGSLDWRLFSFTHINLCHNIGMKVSKYFVRWKYKCHLFDICLRWICPCSSKWYGINMPWEWKNQRPCSILYAICCNAHVEWKGARCHSLIYVR